jgi:tetratricopeptide (TPR) repeat protein
MDDYQRNKEVVFNEAEKIRSGIIAAFPNIDSYKNYIEADKGKTEPFLNVAREYGIIGEDDGPESLELFILENALNPEDCIPPRGMGFTEILEDRVKIKNSVRGLTDWINELVVKFNLQPLMPSGKVSNVMLSRLQREAANTIVKRHTLRLLAFWFGYSRAYLGPVWNYVTFLKMCPRDLGTRAKQGVRIAFDLYSRGDVIEMSSVNWLKNELIACIKDLSFIHHNKFQPFSTTSFFLDLPKEGGFEENVDHPRSYGRAIKDALSIAHQISVRWALSPHSSSTRMLTIGIAAGEFSKLDIYLHSIIRAKLSTDAIIRMTDFAHLCVLVDDIRAVFCESPKEIDVSNGETINIWWVIGLWNTNFWGLVPTLLKDPILQMGSRSDQKFMKALWFDDGSEDTDNRDVSDAVSSFLRTPQHAFLGLEIARTLYFRRRFLAADEILRIILSADPDNLPARTFRMEIYWILGIEAPSYSISEIHFRKAEKEAELINEICTNKIEDYFCEYGLGKMGHALTIMRLLRKGGGKYRENDIILTKEDVLRLLDEARSLFEMGMTLSSRGHRSYYFMIFTLGLRRLLAADEDIFKSTDIPIIDKQGIIHKTALDIYYAIGWLDKEQSLQEQYPVFLNFLQNAVSSYGESILLSTSLPNAQFSFASIMWDFSPILNNDIVITVLRHLYDAYEFTKSLKKEKLCLFSTLRCHRDVLPPDIFLEYVRKAIDSVEEKVGSIKELRKKDKTDVIDPEKLDGLKLFCLNL